MQNAKTIQRISKEATSFAEVSEQKTRAILLFTEFDLLTVKFKKLIEMGTEWNFFFIVKMEHFFFGSKKDDVQIWLVDSHSPFYIARKNLDFIQINAIAIKSSIQILMQFIQ